MLPTLTVLTVAYMLSQYFRTAIAVVAPEMARDLDLSPAELGLLSSAWFWAFAAAQVPVGVALDRYGPRRVAGSVLASAALGCLLLASAGGVGMAVLAQALIGIGCAPVFMATLMVLARFYPPERFALLSSSILAIGNAGTLLGTTPLALAAKQIGWRGTFLVMGGTVALIAVLVATVTRDGPDPHRKAHHAAELAATMRGVAAVLRNRALWPLLPMCFAGYAVLVTVRGLWAGPFLAERFGLEPVARGHVLLLMSCATILGTLAYGAIEQRLDRRREPVLVGSCGAAVALLALAYVPAGSLGLAATLLALVGALGATYPLIMAQGRKFLADHELGRGFTFLNGITFLGAAFLQAVSGLAVAEAEARAELLGDHYALLFIMLAAWLVAAAAIFCRSMDARQYAADGET